MSVAYVDTSCLVAIAFGEPGSDALAGRLESFAELVSANLTEAELRSVLVREAVSADSDVLSGISWILPDRSLGSEIRQVLTTGNVRGADLWHLAAALFVTSSPGEMVFLTLDGRQREAAERLGFDVAP